MPSFAAPGVILKSARIQAGLTQRELAQKARTAQSVVARIELGSTSPSWKTLARLLRVAGYELGGELIRRPRIDPSQLDDVPRILALTAEERLREIAQVSRFITAARRV